MNLKLISVAWTVLLLSAHLSYGFPAVGDYVRYEGTFQSKAVVWELQLTQYDASAKKFKQLQTTTIEGQSPELEETWETASSLPSPENMQTMLNECPAAGGVLETVTVKAGVFPSCRLPVDPDGSSNVGVVPFGTVLGHWTDVDTGSPVTMELVLIRSARASH